jgi:hypothetical protein
VRKTRSLDRHELIRIYQFERDFCERCFRARSREKGIIIIIFTHTQWPLVAKGMDYYRGHYGHKGDAEYHSI